MWLVALLTLLNAVINNDAVNETSSFARIQVGGLPISIYDLLIFTGLALSLIPSKYSRFQTGRTDGWMLWTVIIFTAASLFGIVSALTLETPGRYIISFAHNFAMVPLAIIVGYRATKTLSSGMFYCYLIIIAGVAVATIIPLDFSRGASELTSSKDIDTVRVIQYVQHYAAMAAGLLVFCLGFRGKPIMPRWLCMLLASFCTVGCCATLSRSDWVSVAAMMVVVFLITPTASISRKVILGSVSAVVLVGFLFGGMYVAQQVSGRNVFSKMTDRLASIFGMQEKGASAIEGSRWEAARQELALWGRSPQTIVIGSGFGIQTAVRMVDYSAGAGGFHHNSWTSTLAETGVLGFLAFFTMLIGQTVFGWRMIKRRLDRRTVLIGALAVITGSFETVHGLTTMSFDVMRWALPAAVTFGVMLRTRAIERAMAAMYAGYLPDPADPATPPTPLMDAGSASRPPSLLTAPGGYAGTGEWAGMGQEEYAAY